MFWTITASKWSREITWTHSGKCSIHFHPIFPGVVRKTSCIYPNHIFRGLWVQHDGAAACSSCHSLPGSRDGPASTTYAMASPPCLELLWTQIFAEGGANGCQCCMCATLVSSGFSHDYEFEQFDQQKDVLKVNSGKSFCLGLGPLKLHRLNQRPWELEYLQYPWEIHYRTRTFCRGGMDWGWGMYKACASKTGQTQQRT